ncbi:tRNA dimethylallyltransferase [Alphaproteobacteria bacterium]
MHLRNANYQEKHITSFAELCQKIGGFRDKIVIICGATATGKSALALKLASTINGVVINADSMQVYKEIPVITAQPVLRVQKMVSHKLYGIISCDQGYDMVNQEVTLNNFTVAKWVTLAQEQIDECFKQCKVPIITGGTGMYIHALVNGFAKIPEISKETWSQLSEIIKQSKQQDDALYKLLEEYDPVLVKRMTIGDKQRIVRALAVFLETSIPLSTWQTINRKHYEIGKFFIVWVSLERSEIYSNINQRFLGMVKNGVIEEIKLLITHCIYLPKAIGILEIKRYVDGLITLPTMISKVQQLTRNYAKRQITWFNNKLQYDAVVSKYL